MTEREFGHLKAAQARSIGIGRMDLTVFLERNIDIPVMHRSVDSLKLVSTTLGLTVEPINRVSKEHALRVTGAYCSQPDLVVDAVWVNAASTKYRKALEERNLKANRIDAKLPSDLHADHVINRASLADMIDAGYEPWVMMFEVPASVNTNFGATYETHLPPFKPETPQITLGPAQIFKLYVTDWPKDHAQFLQALEQIRGQICNDGIIAGIQSAFEERFQ
jgi:hypothetical protein